MIATDEDALICDLAETYGIYDYQAYKPKYIAILADGLSGDSRIKMKLSGAKITTGQFLAAYTADKLANLVWMLSTDGENNQNKPKRLLNILLGVEQPEEESSFVSYSTPEEFEKAMEKYR